MPGHWHKTNGYTILVFLKIPRRISKWILEFIVTWYFNLYSIFEGESVTNSILTVTYPSLQTTIFSSFDDSRKVILRMPNSMIFWAEIPWLNERWKINKEYISCLFQLHPIYMPIAPGITSHVKYPGAFLNMLSVWSFWGYFFLI